MLLDPDPNAFVLPGGHVFVHSGLLDLLRDDDDALAFVIGHEMGHQLCRHAMEKTTRAMLRPRVVAAARTSGGATGADFLGGAAAVAALDAADAAVEVAFALPNSREMEREADLVGAGLAARACSILGEDTERPRLARSRRRRQPRRRGRDGDDDAAMETMKTLDTALEAYVSTHPDSESRADALASPDVVARAERDAEGCEARRRDVRNAMRGGGRGGGGEAFTRARVGGVGGVGGGVGGVGGVGGGVGGGVVGGVVGGHSPPAVSGSGRASSERARGE